MLHRKMESEGQESHQLVVPASVKHIVLTALHDDIGHQGRDRTLVLLKTRFFWIGMNAGVDRNVRECGRWIRQKSRPRPAAELVNISSSYPMELVCIDYLSLEPSKGGLENILVITDHFTRLAHAVPTRNQTARTTAKALYENFFIHYGFPAKSHSDKAQNFESKVIRHLCKLAGIRKTRTTPYHPMGNGQVERFNQILLQMLGCLDPCRKSDWKTYVSPLVHAYNATRHESTGFSLFYLMFGRHPRLAIDAFLGLETNCESGKNQTEYVHKLQSRLAFAYRKAVEVAKQQGEHYKRYYDAAVRENKLEVGDRVLIRTVGLQGKHKIADRWDEQPYKVLKQPIPDIPVFDVQKEDGTGRVKTLHRNKLLHITSLPIEELSSAKVAVKTARNRRILDVPDTTVSALTSDSTDSTSSEDEESNEDEPPESQTYHIPMRRNPNEPGLRPRTHPQGRTTGWPTGRPQRNRQAPGWMQSGSWLMQ